MIAPYGGVRDIGLNDFTCAFVSIANNFQRLKILAQMGTGPSAEQRQALLEIADGAMSMVSMLDGMMTSEHEEQPAAPESEPRERPVKVIVRDGELVEGVPALVVDEQPDPDPEPAG